MIMNQLISSISLISLIKQDDPLSNNLPIVDSHVGSLDPLVRFTDMINSQKLLKRVLPILTMCFLFVDDLGHTSSVTTQNTRYVDHRYWPNQVNQSSED